MKRKMILFSAIYGLLLAGTNMVHPVTPAFFQSMNYPDYMFGVAFACMSLTNFLTAPFWGVFSGRLGYIRSFSFGAAGYVVGQLLFFFARTPLATALARLVSGVLVSPFMIGGVLYVSSIAGDEKRGQYVAYLAATQTACSAVGYFVGGMLGTVSIALAFGVQAITCLTASVLALVLFRDEKQADEKETITLAMLNPFKSLIEMRDIMDGFLMVFLGVTLFSSFTTNCFDNSFNYYIRDIFAFPTSYNGIIKAAVGLIGMLANLIINPWLVRKGGLRTSIAWVFGIGMVMLMLLSSTSVILLFVAFALVYYITNAVYQPIQQTLGAQSGSGATYGAFMSIRSLGQMFGGLLAGVLYALNPRLPFYASAAGFALAMLLSFVNARQEKQNA